jgi:hypothetical protein
MGCRDGESQTQGSIFEVFCLELIQSPKNQALAEFKPTALPNPCLQVLLARHPVNRDLSSFSALRHPIKPPWT